MLLFTMYRLSSEWRPAVNLLTHLLGGHVEATPGVSKAKVNWLMLTGSGPSSIHLSASAASNWGGGQAPFNEIVLAYTGLWSLGLSYLWCRVNKYTV